MKRWHIDPDTRLAAVLEGLKGESPIAEICRELPNQRGSWRLPVLEEFVSLEEAHEKVSAF